MIERMGRIAVAAAGTALLLSSGLSIAQTDASTPDPVTQAATALPAATGGTIHGTVKAGPVPLPGVAITATDTLTGKKYATTTDVDGYYAMTIPKTGRYVFGGAGGVCFDHPRGADYGGSSGSGRGGNRDGATGRGSRCHGGWSRDAVAPCDRRRNMSLKMPRPGGGNCGAELPSQANLGDAGISAANDSVAVFYQGRIG